MNAAAARALFSATQPRPLTDEEFAALTPEQLAAAGLVAPSQGAPADFGGTVLPNPDQIEAHWDTDPTPITRLPVGMHLESPVYRGGAQFDVSNPAAADITPAAARTIGAQMGTPQQQTQSMQLPPGAALEAQPAAMQLPPGATLEGAADQGEGSFSDILDRAWGRLKKAVSGEIPLTDYDAATLSGVGTAARDTGHAIAGAAELLKPPSWDEIHQAVKDSQASPANIGTAILARRVGRGVAQTAKQAGQVPAAVHDINQSADPFGTYAKMAQEDLGDLAGQALLGAATEGVVKGGQALQDVSASPAVQAAVKAGAKTAVKSAIKRIPYAGGVAADVADAARTAYREANAPPKATPELDATGENKPFAGGADEYTPARAKPGVRESDATSENRPFAGGADEYTPPKPKPAKAAAPKRTIVVDQKTGQPEFSDVVAARSQASPAAAPPAAPAAPPAAAAAPAPPAPPVEVSAGPAIRGDVRAKMAAMMQELETRDAARASAKESGAGAGDTLEDPLNEMMRAVQSGKSLREITALGKSTPVQTTVPPADLLKRWGVDEESFAEGRSQTRGMKPDESAAAVEQLRKRYAKGEPVEPVMETRDSDNNITDVDGRGRALAAQKAGVERIPIIVRRMPKPTVQ